MGKRPIRLAQSLHNRNTESTTEQQTLQLNDQSGAVHLTAAVLLQEPRKLCRCRSTDCQSVISSPNRALTWSALEGFSILFQ